MFLVELAVGIECRMDVVLYVQRARDGYRFTTYADQADQVTADEVKLLEESFKKQFPGGTFHAMGC